jgi:hypothetical protein
MDRMRRDLRHIERLEVLLAECQNEWEQLATLETYLEEQLEFPFRALCDTPAEPGSNAIQAGDRVTVLGLLEADKQRGIMVRVQKGKRFYRCPLFRLQPKSLTTAQKAAVHDYRSWFHTVGLPEIVELDE